MASSLTLPLRSHSGWTDADGPPAALPGPWPNVSDHEAAAAEAWEEAGVRGDIRADKLGSFTYDKRRDGEFVAVDVVAYLLEVTDEEPIWPEMNERQRAWFSPSAAAQAVAETELKALLLALDI